MIDELRTFEGALARLAHDTLIHLVRQSGPLRMVRAAIPAGWDREAFARGLAERYAARGYVDVEVLVLETEGEPRLLSVVTTGRG